MKLTGATQCELTHVGVRRALTHSNIRRELTNVGYTKRELTHIGYFGQFI